MTGRSVALRRHDRVEAAERIRSVVAETSNEQFEARWDLLRHGYEHVAPPILLTLVRDDLPAVETVCRQELARMRA